MRGRLVLASLAPVPVLIGAALAVPAAPQGEPLGTRPITVKLTEPVDNDFIFGKVRIAAEVKAPGDGKGTRVEFSVGGKLVFIDREAPWEVFHDFGDDPRSWVIEAVAVAADGATARDTVVTRKLTIDYRELVDRVIVTATAVDDDRRFVAGLTRDDFSLFEDDVAQPIIDFSLEARPITMALLIDTSGSMREELEEVQEAAKSFVETLRPEDKALIIDFDENVYLLQELTADRNLLRHAIEGTDAEGGTAFYDALFAAYRAMRGIDGRKTIVMLTDGADTNSRFSYQKVLEWTKTHEVSIYAIGMGATVLDVGIRSSLKQLSDETGGRAFFPKSAADLAGVYQQIAQDLKSQYYITYSPSNRSLDGSWRKIRLETAAKGVKLKTRRGYYAVKR
ncbi:MAG TPA: VWA domain-containing protein [Candidatus Polarisedimenticolia bacterium]|nr:VWA domain-containing protein [Candidatus Polarisedimenticolia bacterium]